MMIYFRRVIRIRAEDSPNVILGLAQKAAGLVPDDRTIVPGVIGYLEYLKRRATWDKVRQCVGLDGLFYEGAELLMFPPDWLTRAGRLDFLQRCRAEPVHAIGVDPAEGGDSTAMAAVNKWGLKELVSKKTRDTNSIPQDIINFGTRHGADPKNWVIDRGGGGKQHADRLRAMGYPVRTVAFGETVTLDPKRGLQQLEKRLDVKEDKAAYANRRAEMYDELSQLLDPGSSLLAGLQGINDGSAGWSIPEGLRGNPAIQDSELRHQLAPIPRKYKDGKMVLLPKNNPNDPEDPRTLVMLIGHSPDEADAVALAVHGLLHKGRGAVAGPAF